MKSLLTSCPTPSFWYGQRRPWERLAVAALAPVSFIYAALVRQRFGMYHPVPMSRPVVCVGNVVAGGAGKTPVVMALVRLLQEKGANPHILSRGYGGQEEGPLQVSPERDTAEDVGDEPLLLVEAAPTWVSRSRPLGVQAAIDTGATVIVMDDGFQNPSFYKDFSLLVIDGQTGLGNGRVMPAGPLRESFSDALLRADAVVILGDDRRDLTAEIAQHRGDLPVFKAQLRPAAGAPDVAGQKVYAFAGIGRPEKFRRTLEQAGAEVEGWAAFPDHYSYEEDDLKEMLRDAAEKGFPVYTTQKDYVRLPVALRDSVKTFAIEADFEDGLSLLRCIEETLARRHGAV